MERGVWNVQLDHPSILITDDDAAMRQTLCGLFEPRGFRTLTAGNGEEALQIVERERIHLLLLHLHNPKEYLDAPQ